MRIKEICTREVVYCDRHTNLVEAAQLMRKDHVGDLLVVGEVAGEKFPVGIVTDRDIVVEVVAKQVDPATLRVGDIMGRKLVTIEETEDVFEALKRMHLNGVRRLPVVDKEGGLAGIVTVDDLFEALGLEMMELVRVISRERLREGQTRR
jgi:CBS domain-containing protein